LRGDSEVVVGYTVVVNAHCIAAKWMNQVKVENSTFNLQLATFNQ
jgi:hypothetical protein